MVLQLNRIGDDQLVLFLHDAIKEDRCSQSLGGWCGTFVAGGKQKKTAKNANVGVEQNTNKTNKGREYRIGKTGIGSRKEDEGRVINMNGGTWKGETSIDVFLPFFSSLASSFFGST